MEHGKRKRKQIFVFVCSSHKPTCKLPVTVATVTKLGDQLAVELEDKDAAGFVVHHDDVTVPVHRNAFRAHELPGADLILRKSSSGITGNDVTCKQNAVT